MANHQTIEPPLVTSTVSTLGWPRLAWRVQADGGREDRYWLFKRAKDWALLIVLGNGDTSMKDQTHLLRFDSLFDLETYIDDVLEPGAWGLLAETAQFGASELYEH